LKDLSRASTVGNTVANFVQSVAAGEEPLEISKELPRDMQRYLRELSLASGGTAKFFKMVPCAVEAVCMRLCGTPISQDAEATLSELEKFGDGNDVAKFLRDLSTGGSRPSRLKTAAQLTSRFAQTVLFPN